MRIIKFSGKDIYTGELVYGHYTTSVEGPPEQEYTDGHRTAGPCLLHYVSVDGENIPHIVYPETVGRCKSWRDN